MHFQCGPIHERSKTAEIRALQVQRTMVGIAADMGRPEALQHVAEEGR